MWPFNTTPVDSTTYRELAGVRTAKMVVYSYLAFGWAVSLIPVYTDKAVAVPADWNSAMLGLVGGALGYLIGKQSTTPSAPVQPNVVVPTGETTTTTVRTE